VPDALGKISHFRLFGRTAEADGGGVCLQVTGEAVIVIGDAFIVFIELDDEEVFEPGGN